MDVEPVVFVISGDSKARRSLSLRLKQLGCDSRACHSPEDFLQKSSPREAGCILLHASQTEIDLDWLTTLGRHEDHWPVIGIATEADVETAVLAMKRGAFDFLLESCNDQRLRDAVDEAFRWDADQRRHIAHVQAIRRRLKQLAPPLRDVLDLLLKGKSNREIADELGLSVRSIEVRRSKVMKTMKARTLAALVRLTLLAHGMGPSRPSPVGDRWIQHAAHASELNVVASRSYRSTPPR
ncbi:MAG: response regulator transcription factor [Thermoguttaceae bacterium]